MRRWTVGVDFGGTTIKCGLVDHTGHVTQFLSLSSKRFGQPDAFVEVLSERVEQLGRSAGLTLAHLDGVGVGVPGLIDAKRGVVHRLVNVKGWHDVPLAQRLSRRLRTRVAVENDVNLVALGEWRWGAGRGARSLVCLTLGTGVGGGLIFDGALYRGVSGAAGEIGHMVVDPRGRRCGCGSRGCLEAQVGTAAILSMARRVLPRDRGPLAQLVKAQGHLTPAVVARAAREGDRHAQAIWSEIGRTLGRALAGVVNLLNPDRIVIGGGVAGAWRWFAPTLRATLLAHAMELPARTVHVVRAQLGDRAGVIGAAVLVWNQAGGGG